MAQPSGKQLWIGLTSWLAVCFVAAAIGSVASISAPEFYARLNKPDWAPSASLFGPVWSVLYALMGIAAWLVWRAYSFRPISGTLYLFLLQLAINALWSWLFFVWHLGMWAFADIVLLWLMVAATLGSFWRLRPLAGMLLIPYLLWITFAAALCYSIWQLNPALLGTA
jgi:tryptophan-rich sensory protein